MKTVAVVSRKGGSGKTTLSCNLATIWASGDAPVTVVDIDPQSSAAMWHRRRSDQQPTVVTTTAPLLGSILESARTGGIHWALIDTAPHQDADALAAAACADLVLVPLRPQQTDLDALSQTIRMLQLTHTPAWAVITQAHPTAVYEDLGNSISAAGLRVCPVILRQRQIYSEAWGEGLGAAELDPLSKAALELKNLGDWVKEVI